MIRILLVEDDTLARQAVKLILSEAPDLAVLGEARDTRQAVELAGAREWDLVVLDLTLPDRCGLDLLKDLKEMSPDLPVLVLSMRPEEPWAARTLVAGAAGYVTKARAPRELIPAIRAVLAARTYERGPGMSFVPLAGATGSPGLE